MNRWFGVCNLYTYTFYFDWYSYQYIKIYGEYIFSSNIFIFELPWTVNIVYLHGGLINIVVDIILWPLDSGR